MSLAQYIDHTLLKQEATETDYEKLFSEALEFSFFSVCVPPTYITKAKEKLSGSNVKACTVIGFPFGYSSLETKVFEIQDALSKGADEIDVVINISSIKNKDWTSVEKEVENFANAKGSSLLKIIVESGILTTDEIKKLCEIFNKYAVDFMKTSSGFAKTGATEEAVKTMHSHLKPEIKIKASGGIRTAEDAQKYINLGADRLGCSSSVTMVS